MPGQRILAFRTHSLTSGCFPSQVRQTREDAANVQFSAFDAIYFQEASITNSQIMNNGVDNSFGLVTALWRIPAAQRAERTNALMIREQRAPVSQSVSQSVSQ